MFIGDLAGNDCVDLFFEKAHRCARLTARHRSDRACLRSYLSTTSFSSDIREHFEIGTRRLAGPCDTMCGARSLLWSAARMDPVTTAVSTHCPYCALQCGMDVTCDGDRIEIAGNKRFPVNEGGLCLKGWTAAETIRHPERLLSPLVRNAAGTLEPASWQSAIDRIASAIRCDAGGLRPRCGRRVRRRVADQREGVSAGKVRACRAGHVERRLQRPILHVVGCGRSVEGLRSRSRPSVSARRHSARRSHPARGRESGRDDAARHAVLRGSTAQRRRADCGRPAPLANRPVGEAASGAASGL